MGRSYHQRHSCERHSSAGWNPDPFIVKRNLAASTAGDPSLRWDDGRKRSGFNDGFTLLEMVWVLAFMSLLIATGLSFFARDQREFLGLGLQQNLEAKLYALRQQAMYQGATAGLSNSDVADSTGIRWQQKPLLAFSASGYPSKSGTLIFQAGEHLRKLTVMPASGAIKVEVAGL